MLRDRVVVTEAESDTPSDDVIVAERHSVGLVDALRCEERVRVGVRVTEMVAEPVRVTESVDVTDGQRDTVIEALDDRETDTVTLCVDEGDVDRDGDAQDDTDDDTEGECDPDGDVDPHNVLVDDCVRDAHVLLLSEGDGETDADLVADTVVDAERELDCDADSESVIDAEALSDSDKRDERVRVVEGEMLRDEISDLEKSDAEDTRDGVGRAVIVRLEVGTEETEVDPDRHPLADVEAQIEGEAEREGKRVT